MSLKVESEFQSQAGIFRFSIQFREKQTTPYYVKGSLIMELTRQTVMIISG